MLAPWDAFLGRVSSEEQAEKGNIQSQVHFAKKYFDLHGVNNYKMYLDEGVSGTIPLDERPDASILIKDIKAGKIKNLYVYRLDRLARSTKIVLDTYELLEKHNVPLISMTENFDSATSNGKFFMTMLASVAALERDTIMERTSQGKERGARANKWVAGAPPFGYRIGDDGCLVIYEPEEKTIKLIYELYMSGMGTVPIAEYLNAMGILTPAKSKNIKSKSTGKWHAGHISIILNNSIYTGTYEYLSRSKFKKATITMQTPVIIPSKIYGQVQKKLGENSDVAKGSKGRLYLLRGKIFCGHCGWAYVGSSGDSKAGRVYYRCGQAINKGYGKMCDAKMIRADQIEQAVWEDIAAHIKNPGEIEEEIKKQIANVTSEMEPTETFSHIENKIKEKKDARAKTISLCTRGIITDQEAEKELSNLANEIKILEQRANELFNQREKQLDMQTQSIEISARIEEVKDKIDYVEDETKQELIKLLVDNINVFTYLDASNKRKSKVQIIYKFFPQPLYEVEHFNKCLEPYNVIAQWIFHSGRSVQGERIGTGLIKS